MKWTSVVAAAAARTLGTANSAAAAPPPPWSIVSTPAIFGTQVVLDAVAVVSPGQTFAAGYVQTQVPGAVEWRTLVERWDGAQWQRMNTPNRETAPAQNFLRGIAGTSATDVWAVGSTAAAVGQLRSVPYAIHYDGSVWKEASVPDPSGGTGASISAITMVSPSNVWAVGTSYPLNARPAVYHFDGSSWSAERLPVPDGCSSQNFTELMAVTATASGEIYAGGNCPTAAGWVGVVLHKVGSTWKTVAMGPANSDITAMTTRADGTVWAVGTQSVFGSGSRGYALFGSQDSWTRKLRPLTSGSYENFSGVTESAGRVVVVGTSSTTVATRKPLILSWFAPHWRPSQTPAQSAESWLSSVASSGSTTWATGQTFGPSGLIPITARP